MNRPHINDENDTSLNEGLDRLSTRYGRLQQDEPPELLDLAILNRAHRALEKKPHWMKFGWLHGLTTAAVFVLAFSLILNQSESPPVFENGLKNNEPVSSPREMVAKKQSLDIQPGDSRKEMKEKNEARQEMLQSMPAAAAPERPAMESARDDKAGKPGLEAQSASYAGDSLQVKGQRSDKDAEVSGLLVEEEIASDEVDLMADTPGTGAMHELNLPTERAKTDSEVEQRLQEIIRLKQSGDETWKTALESFRESYPDYPLPDELAQ